MSDAIAQAANGQHMFAWYGEKPWHLKGQESPTPMTPQEALDLSHTGFPLEQKEIYIASPREIDGIPIVGNKAKTHKAIVRGDTGEIIGIVGSEYEPVDNTELMGIMDALVGEGHLELHTCGGLFDGSHFFATAKIPQTFLDSLGLDTQFENRDRYILLASAHNGSMRVHLKWTDVRVVCRNTLSLALGAWVGSGRVKAAQSEYAIRHTKNCRSRIDEIRKALGLYGVYQKMLDMVFDKLVHTPFEEADMDAMTKALIPDARSDRGKTRVQNQRQEMMEMFYNGAGHNDIKGTAYAALQAVVEKVDHKDGGRKTDKDPCEAEFFRVNFGSGAVKKQDAMDYLSKVISDDSLRRELIGIAV